MLDPFAQNLLKELERASRPPIETLDIEAARFMVRGWIDRQGSPDDVARVVDIMVKGADGPIPARFYQPAEARPILIVYFHGGGWMSGDLDLVDIPLRRLANATGAQVLSIAYRLAPESKFPGGLEDCYAVVAEMDWMRTELQTEWGKVVVAGDSAGGNLAAAVTLLSRDRGTVGIDGQILLYPVMAPSQESPFRSLVENGEGFLLTRAALIHYWKSYLGSPAQASDQYASPLLARSLKNLPPTFIVTAGFDPLRDEGHAFADRMRMDGVEVAHHDYAGQLHAFFWMPASEGFQRFLVDIRKWLDLHFTAVQNRHEEF